MDLNDVGKAVERLLRDTEQLAAHTPGDAQPRDAQTKKAVDEFGASLRNFFTVFGRMRSEMRSATDKARPTACARAWLNACFAKKLFTRIEGLFRVIKVRAAAVVGNTGEAESRYAQARAEGVAHPRVGTTPTAYRTSQVCSMATACGRRC